jgi:hypothetical protein
LPRFWRPVKPPCINFESSPEELTGEGEWLLRWLVEEAFAIVDSSLLFRIDWGGDVRFESVDDAFDSRRSGWSFDDSLTASFA